MLTARRLTAPALLTVTLALAYLATATAASAMPAPPPDGGYVGQPPLPPTTVVTHTGSPMWTYVVVALAAAVLTLALAWLVARLRHARAGAVSTQAA
jgi:hypothetical protein